MVWAFLVCRCRVFGDTLKTQQVKFTPFFCGMTTKSTTMNIFHELQRISANIRELHNKNVKILVDAEKFAVCSKLFENVKLLPIIRNQQIGFVDKEGVIIIKPIYNDYQGVFLHSPQTKMCVKKGNKWGIIDSKGLVWVDFEYDYISPEVINYDLYPSYSQHLYSINQNYQWAVINDSGSSIDKLVDFGIYDWIDGYDSGLARVKKKDKWGIIDYKGKLVLPLEYDNIWNFYNKKRVDTIVEKGLDKSTIKYSELITIQEKSYIAESYEDDYDCDYPSIYNNPHYNNILDLNQQDPEFWDSL